MDEGNGRIGSKTDLSKGVLSATIERFTAILAQLLKGIQREGIKAQGVNEGHIGLSLTTGAAKTMTFRMASASVARIEHREKVNNRARRNKHQRLRHEQ